MFVFFFRDLVDVVSDCIVRGLTFFAASILALMIGSALFSYTAIAQEDSAPVVVVSQPADLVSPDSQVTLQFLIEMVIKAAGAMAFSYAGGAQLVQMLTGLLKKAPAITNRISPPTIVFCLSFILSFGAALASHFGFFPQYNNAIAGATTILAGLFGTRLLAAQSHDSYVKDKARGLAVLGSSSASTQTSIGRVG